MVVISNKSLVNDYVQRQKELTNERKAAITKENKGINEFKKNFKVALQNREYTYDKNKGYKPTSIGAVRLPGGYSVDVRRPTLSKESLQRLSKAKITYVPKLSITPTRTLRLRREMKNQYESDSLRNNSTYFSDDSPGSGFGRGGAV